MPINPNSFMFSDFSKFEKKKMCVTALILQDFCTQGGVCFVTPPFLLAES